MSDIEHQRRALVPDSGMLVAKGGGTPTLSNAMIALAHTFHGGLLASAIQRCHERGGTWFPYSAIGSSHCHTIAAEGEALGLWRKHDIKSYYMHTDFTMRWVREALAWERPEHEPERAKNGPRG